MSKPKETGATPIEYADPLDKRANREKEIIRLLRLLVELNGGTP